MFSPLPTPEEMSGWDRRCVDEFGLSGRILMENASREALGVLKEHFGSLRGRCGVVVAGSGNNGGDGFALARHLWNLGAKNIILHTKQCVHRRHGLPSGTGRTHGYTLLLPP
jgi:NAD(P)H-hydrate epimerase